MHTARDFQTCFQRQGKALQRLNEHANVWRGLTIVSRCAGMAVTHASRPGQGCQGAAGGAALARLLQPGCVGPLAAGLGGGRQGGRSSDGLLSKYIKV